MSQQPARTIEWTCPDSDIDDIVQSLVNRYLEEGSNLPGKPMNGIEYRFGGHFSAYGAFVKKARYHLGIVELNALHGKDVQIKGLSNTDATEIRFSILLFFYNPNQALLRVLDSA